MLVPRPARKLALFCGAGWYGIGKPCEGWLLPAPLTKFAQRLGSALPGLPILSHKGRGRDPDIGVMGRGGDATLPLLPLWEKVSPPNVPACSGKGDG